MSSRRALVVDDSKSARAFLSRILERHELTVDTAESAEAAIEYLTRNRPDVIFMDHLMPGMDGFQAVQSIKNNPRTSAIPILMYTSQEGDLYAGQARALGADGVLPKQIKQSDVTKMLFQLRLVSDRRGEEQNTFTRMTPAAQMSPANEAANEVALGTPAPEAIIVPSAIPTVSPAALAAPASATDISKLLPELSLEIRAAFVSSLQTEIAALRGYLGSALDTHAERLQGDVAALMPSSARMPQIDLPTVIPERRTGTIVAWVIALLALGGAGFMGWQWYTQGTEVAALRTDLAAAYAENETLRARPEVASPPAPAADASADPATAAAAPVAGDAIPPPAGTSSQPATTAASVIMPASAQPVAASTVATTLAPAPVAAPAAAAATRVPAQ
jgi:CheY-like chemotaxis protein